jgi:hypothetical protein
MTGSEAISQAVVPRAIAPGPPPGAWRQEGPDQRQGDRLFSSIIVTVTGTESGWHAVDQTLGVAQREVGSRSLARSTHCETFAQFPVFGRYQNQELDLTEDLYRGCMANRLLFEGWTLLGKELFELQRAVDVLCTLPDADADGERLGAIGHSAGGLMSALLMYVDPRIVVGCASSGTKRWVSRSGIRASSMAPKRTYSGQTCEPGHTSGSIVG